MRINNYCHVTHNGILKRNPRRFTTFKVVVKPASVMGDYIALHGLLPENELPYRFRHKIPKHEIWIRSDVYNNPARRDRILKGHEKFELELMTDKGMNYKQAHKRAELHEKVYKLTDWIGSIQL